MEYFLFGMALMAIIGAILGHSLWRNYQQEYDQLKDDDD